MAKRTIIDPPEGWKYGFPKPIPEDLEDLGVWLVNEGYPTHQIQLALKYSRYWEEDVPEEET